MVGMPDQAPIPQVTSRSWAPHLTSLRRLAPRRGGGPLWAVEAPIRGQSCRSWSLRSPSRSAAGQAREPRPPASFHLRGAPVLIESARKLAEQHPGKLEVCAPTGTASIPVQAEGKK